MLSLPSASLRLSERKESVVRFSRRAAEIKDFLDAFWGRELV